MTRSLAHLCERILASRNGDDNSLFDAFVAIFYGDRVSANFVSFGPPVIQVVIGGFLLPDHGQGFRTAFSTDF